MNCIHKIVWSKVKNSYVVVSELVKSHTKNTSVQSMKIALAIVVGMPLMMSGYIADAAIDGVTTFVEPGNQNIKMGNGISLRNNAATNGAIAIGDHAQIDDYVMQEGSIAIGKNAFVENMYGNQEKFFKFGQSDEKKWASSIAIGQNAYARSGSTMIGDHKYVGKLGDVEVDGSDVQKVKSRNVNINATTIGANSYNQGAFSSVTGTYSIISGKYNGGNWSSYVTQNMGATIYGSLNSIESNSSSSAHSGIASSVIGLANRTANSNGTLIFGAGNEVTNSIGIVNGINPFSGGGASAKEFAEQLKSSVKSSDGGGSTMAFGGGNTADWTHATSIIGVNNTIKGSSGKVSAYNLLTGYKNTATNVNRTSIIGSRNEVENTTSAVLLGDLRRLKGAHDSVILGSGEEGNVIETNVSKAVVIGSKANVTKEGGVALGAKSVSNTDKGVAGYNPETKAASTDTSSTWKSTAAAVAVGDAEHNVTRQITGVAAGTKDTDAVNVAQLKKAMANATGDGNDTLVNSDNALSLAGNTLSMSVKDTAGHEVKGSVNLSALAAAVDTRNTVAEGDHIKIDEEKQQDGSSKYTIHVKTDGVVEKDNKGIVTGGTVYNETRITTDGNYIKKDNSAADNLMILDGQVKKNADSITNINNQFNELGRDVNRVGAMGAALSALKPLTYDPYEPTQIMAGYGNYRGSNAIALGVAHYNNESTMMHAGVSYGGKSHMMVNAGVTVKVGSSDKEREVADRYRTGPLSSVYVMQKEIDHLTSDNQALRSTVNEQNAKLSEQDAKIEKLMQIVQELASK